MLEYVLPSTYIHPITLYWLANPWLRFRRNFSVESGDQSTSKTSPTVSPPTKKKQWNHMINQPTVWHQKNPEKIPTFQVFNRCFPQSLHPPNPTPKSDKSPIFDAGIPEVMSRSLKANWWFGAPWFGVPLRIPIPFIFGDPQNPNHRGPKPPLNH